MRKFITFTLGLLLITFTSCNSNNKSETPVKKENEAQLGRELTKEETRAMERIENRNLKKNESRNKSKNNLISPYRYLISSEDYPIFTELVKSSNLSKHIHSAGVTVLAPKDEAFNAYPKYRKLLEQGNKTLLDEFISHHIINTIYEYKEFSEDGRYTVHAGKSYILDNRSGITFNGAHVRTDVVVTEAGTIIGFDDLVYFPEIK
jgi:uncharacterized surface protein with fasciclin (FAS1) repeats